MFPERLIVIDTETGGLDPQRHSLLSVALLVVDGDEILAEREWKILHDTYHVDVEALKLNQIDLRIMDQEGTPAKQVAEEIILFLRTHCSDEQKGMYVGQNTIFDKSFMESFFVKFQDAELIGAYHELISRRYLDLMSLTAFLNISGLIETDGLGLDKVIDLFKLTVGTRHSAVDDAKVTFQALQKMKSLMRQPALA